MLLTVEYEEKTSMVFLSSNRVLNLVRLGIGIRLEQLDRVDAHENHTFSLFRRESPNAG